MTREEYIGFLFKKYLANECTRQEAAELIDIIRSEENKNLIQGLINQHFEDEIPEELLPNHQATEKVFQRLKLSFETKQASLSTTFKLPSWLKIAASLLLISGAAVISYKLLSSVEKEKLPVVTRQDVAPGRNRGTLLLSNGKEVTLNDLKVGNIEEDEGVLIKKLADGQLVYITTANPKNPNAENTVKTPRGGQYQVILPDGSKVWLNAASSITYPAAFSGDERHVKLTGEGYFEITALRKNKKKVSFIVETGRQKIEVLGTKFNVNAYDDGSGIRTTLVEGKVKVTTDNDTIILRPNQEFNLGPEEILIRKVDIEPAIDWKNGDFIFADEDVKSIMRKIARWYNVDVVYENEIPNDNVTAQISRNRNLSEVLRMLELSGETKFKIENRTVRISYNKNK